MPNAPPGWPWIEPVDSTTVNLWYTVRASDAAELEVERSEDDGATWASVATGVDISGLTGGKTDYRGKPNVNNELYVDSTAQPDAIYLYRTRFTDAGGLNPTAWQNSWNTEVMPPDDILPAVPREVVTAVPNCQGTVHTPIDGPALTTLLNTVGFSRGDIIELDKDTTYGPGPFTFPKLVSALTGDRDQDFVLVRTSDWQNLPDADERVELSDEQHMPELFADTTNQPVIDIPKGANHYFFLGLKLNRGSPASRSNGLLDCYTIDFNDVLNEERDAQPNNIILDRMIFDGGPDNENQGMAVYFNCDWGAILNCHFEQIKTTSGDKQVVGIHFAYGPILIQNNWMVNGTTMNCMTGPGGSGPGQAVGDLIFRRNVMGTLPKWDRRSFSFNFDAPGGGKQWTDLVIDAVNPAIIGRPTNNADQLVNGDRYRITTAGTTDFTLIGAANNNVGTVFNCTGPGTGTGTATGVMNALTYRMIIRVDAGTGFLPGRYKIRGMDPNEPDPEKIEFDRPVGTVGSTGGTITRSTSNDIKNTWESKNSHRTLFEENIFLACPVGGQPGYKMFFGPRAGGNGPPNEYSWVKSAFDVTVRWNHFTNHAGYVGMQIDDTQASGSDTVSLGGRRVLFENNLFEDTLDHNEALFQLSQGSSWPTWPGLTIRHNTFVARRNEPDSLGSRNSHSNGAFAWSSSAVPPFHVSSGSIIGNVFTIGTKGSAQASGSQDLATSLSAVLDPAVELRDNVWIDVDTVTPGIPAGDVSANTYEEVFTDWYGKDFSIKPAFQGIVSPPVLRGQTNPGCDIDELRRRLRGVYDGKPAKQVVAVA